MHAHDERSGPAGNGTAPVDQVEIQGQDTGVAVPVAVGAVPDLTGPFAEVWEGDQAQDPKPFATADKPADDQDPAPVEPDPVPAQVAKLQPKHLAELRALGVDDATIDRLKIRTYYDHRGPVGWQFEWTDGADTVLASIPDRDKRRGPKVEWPKGQTLIVGCIRYAEGSTRHVIVEGPRQALAVAAYGPADVSVWVMNGSNGIHRKIVDRLRHFFAGEEVTIMVDADWRTNGQVGRAATEDAPEHLAQAGVVNVLVADVGGKGTDGIDDIILTTPEQDRAGKVAEILDNAKPARDRRLELETERELIRLQAREQAQRIYVAQSMADVPGPAGTLLGDLLDEPDDAPIYRVDGLWPTGGNVVFSAQRKAGKTTARDNLTRCLVDGDNFLGKGGQVRLVDCGGFEVQPLATDERVYVTDLELDRRTLRRWLGDQRIKNKDKVLVQSFRGRLASFDVLDDKRRSAWATFLAGHNVKVLIVDPLAALLDAYGFDENDKTEVGRVLVSLDQLKAEAGVSELMIVHHMGHNGERSRGTSRLRDWPDAEWFLVRERPDNRNEEPPPDAARFFGADGRDVAVRETKLDFDQATRRLSIAGGNRVQHKATRDMPVVLEIIAGAPGLNGRELETRGKFKAGISRDRVRAAVTALIEAGKVRAESGPNNATLHYPVADRFADDSASANGGDDA
jgi:hypothetical protein